MAIDMASVYAERFRKNPDALRAAVLGQSPDPKLDSYTALNALRLVKEADMMEMAGKAQQPTSSPSILAESLAPPAPPQGMAGMIPMGAPAGQMPQQRAPMPQPTMQAASGGLAGMYTPDEDYAAGGIVAFDGTNGSLVRDPDAPEFVSDRNSGSDMLIPISDIDGSGDADPTTLTTAQKMLAKYMGFEPQEMTVAQQEAFLDRYEKRMEKDAGPDIYAPARADTEARRAGLAGDRRSGEGMALLTAAGKILKGRSLAEGASEALPAFAQQMGEVRRAEREEKRAIAQMNFALDDAQRKERMGNKRGAQAALAEARKFQQDANKAEGDKLRYGADIAARTVQYSRQAKGAGAQPSGFNVLFNAKQALSADPKNPQLQAAVKNAAEAVAATKQSFSMSDIPTGGAKDRNAVAAITSKENVEANKALDKHKLMQGREWRKSVEAAGGVEAAENQFKKKWITNNPQSADGEAPPPKPTVAPAAAPKPTTTSKAVSMADVRATVTSSGRTEQEVIDALKAKGYTIK